MNLAIVAFACQRDEAMVAPWLALAARCYPGAALIIANDTAAPAALPVGTLTVPADYATLGQCTAVPRAMLAASRLRLSAGWLVKTDIDVAHLSDRWLRPCLRGAELVGLQNSRCPWGFWGWAYAATRDMTQKLHDGAPLPLEHIHEEDHRASLVSRWHSPNGIILHRYDPLGKGIYCTWNPEGCRSIPVYRSRFMVVHCGPRNISRGEAANVMHAFADAAAKAESGKQKAEIQTPHSPSSLNH